MWEIFVANLFFILAFLIIPIIIFFMMRNNCSTCSEKKCPISLCMPIVLFFICWGSAGYIMYNQAQEVSEKEYVKIQQDLEKYEFNSELTTIIADAYSNKGYVSNHEFDKFKKAQVDRSRKNVEELKDKISNDVNNLDIERK